MFTITYRGFDIYGDSFETRVIVDFKDIKIGYPSIKSAKLAITKRLRNAYGYSTMSAANKRIYGFK